MQLWVALSLGAAFLQNLRTALQKALTARVGVTGAVYARFLFAAPWAVLLLLALAGPGGVQVPGINAAFVLWALAGAASQIAATFLLLRVFAYRNFAVGNTFAKTETVQAALLGSVLIGDRIGAWPLAGIFISLAGILLLSGPRGLGWSLLDRAAALGLLSGAGFAVSGVAYRAAGLSLGEADGLLIRPGLTLAFVTAAQTLAMTAWLLARSPAEIGAVLRHWRIAAPIGLAGMLASFGWFAAFTLATAAQVKAVGQVELVFSWLTARFAFGERPSGRETLGIALVAGGIVLLVLTS
jgi:drug/metabolite transporter (DMT)-like permease